MTPHTSTNKESTVSKTASQKLINPTEAKKG